MVGRPPDWTDGNDPRFVEDRQDPKPKVTLLRETFHLILVINEPSPSQIEDSDVVL